ncbi:hypothetical protein J2Z43_001453 [Clostridioides mangenotii]|uniref:Uncharacterized protein n=1 Tax=Metaclostridioides mangenotii TaxID=1540 RepID=A0ABS4EAU8_9FIRM|nr:hypothetical protein [Clostridioides mangenotii]
MKNKKIVSLFVAFTLFCTSINFSFAETDTEDSVIEITNESKEENSSEGSVKDESELGMLKGWILKKWSSSTGLIGIARKGVIFAVLIVAVYLDRLISNGT